MRSRPLGTVLFLTAALALAGCGSDDPQGSATPSAGPTSVPSTPADSPSAAATQDSSPSPVAGGEGEGGIVLGGIELGVTRIGAPFPEAVTKITAVLGEPTENPKTSVTCIEATKEVAWGSFLLAEVDGEVAGWESTSNTLQTPAGVTVGTDVATLKQVYGAGVSFFAPNPDSGATFDVDAADVHGGLTSQADDGTVTALYSGFCGPP